MHKHTIRRIQTDLRASILARDSLLIGLNTLINGWPDITKKFHNKVMNLRFKKALNALLKDTDLSITGVGNDYELHTYRRTFYDEENQVTVYSNIKNIYFSVETTEEKRITSLEKTLAELEQYRHDMVYHLEQDNIAIDNIEKTINTLESTIITAQKQIDDLKIPLDARQSVSQRLFYGRDINLRL